MFNRGRCSIPTVYCGDKDQIPTTGPSRDTHYSRRGTARECLSKGFGAGMITEKLKNLTLNSLQRIKYIGDKYEQKFVDVGITNTDRLVTEMRRLNAENINRVLCEILRRKNGVVDKRAFNSVLLFLDDNGVNNLPECETF